MTDRRGFIGALVAAPWLATRRSQAAGRTTSMYLAYTSFAVRMAQGRDLLKTNAAALGADAFRQLCVQFGAAGGQMDLSQVPVGDAAALTATRGAFERDHVALEVSIPSRYLETPEAYAGAVGAARALGATPRPGGPVVRPPLRELRDGCRLDGVHDQMARDVAAHAR